MAARKVRRASSNPFAGASASADLKTGQVKPGRKVRARPKASSSDSKFVGAHASGKTNIAAGVGKSASGSVKVKRKSVGGSGLATVEGASKVASVAASKAVPAVIATSAPVFAATTAVIGSKVPAVKAIYKGANKIAGNAGRDLIDIPANTPASLYKVGSDAAHDPRKGVADLVQPYKDLAKHPLKSLVDHPVGTVLLADGARGTVGRTAGRTLRVASGGRLASTAGREALETPGVERHVARSYSKDVIVKQGQKALDSGRVPLTRARRSLKETGRTNAMRPKDYKRAVALDVKAAGNEAHAAEHEARAKATEALGKKPTAAVSTVVQGITHVSENDIRAYRDHVAAQIPKMTSKLAKQRAQHLHADLTDALKHHDPAKTQEAANRYAEVMRPLEAQAIKHGLIGEREATISRATPAAVRHLDATPENRSVALKAAVADEKATNAMKRTAKVRVARAKDSAAKAKANARVSVAKRDASVIEAERGLLNAREQVHAARLAHARKPSEAAVVRVKSALSGQKAAADRLKRERSRTRGVAPGAADALRSALSEQKDARGILRAANDAQRNAVRVRKATRRADFANADGPVAATQVANTIGRDPVFVTHNLRRPGGSALPVERSTIPVKEARSGEAVLRGTVDASPAKLVEQAGDTARQVVQARYRERFVKDFGYRERPESAPVNFRNEDLAKNAAEALAEKTGEHFEPIAAQGKNHWVLVPHHAVDALREFEKNSNQANDVVQSAMTSGRRIILSNNPARRIVGDAAEAAIRSAVDRAGPRSYFFARETLKHLDPEQRAHVEAKLFGGGQSRTAEQAASERLVRDDVSGIVRAARKVRNAPGARHVAELYGKYTQLVLHTVSGKIETAAQTAMLGAELRRSPLIEDRIVKLSQDAYADAAKGLHDSSALDQYARALNDAFGRYQGYPAKTQRFISTYTPFAMWSLSAANFLFRVMPRDHPTITALTASANQASEQWRKQHGLVLDITGRTPGQLPIYKQGSVPGYRGGSFPAARFSPTGGAASLADPGSLFLPQLGEIVQNLAGNDYTGSKLTGSFGDDPSPARKSEAAVFSFLEGQVPFLSTAEQASGVSGPNKADGRKPKPGRERASNLLDPTAPIKNSSAASSGAVMAKGGASEASRGPQPIRVRPIKVKPIRVKPIVVR